MPGAAQFNDFFRARRRDGKQLDLPEHRDVELVALLPGAKQQPPALKAAQLAAHFGQALQVISVDARKQRQGGQVTWHVKFFQVHGVGLSLGG